MTIQGHILMAVIGCASTSPAGQAVNQIRSVDFYNFTYHSGSWGERITLRNGRYKRKDSIGSALFTISALARLQYADLKGDGREQAIITIRTKLNGSGPTAVDYYVFEDRNGSPRQIFHEWREGLAAIYVARRCLRIAAAFWAREDAHCCPSYTETMTYRWRTSRFTIASRRLRKDHPFQNPRSLKQLTSLNVL